MTRVDALEPSTGNTKKQKKRRIQVKVENHNFTNFYGKAD
jgi:hypothetical protein